jgi:regulatory protein
MPAPPRALSLKGRALKHLAAREHSRAELQRKLAPHTDDADALAALLDDLQSRGLLREERFVESLIHRRAGRLGVARVRQELSAKGVNPADHHESLAALQGTEPARAHDLWQRRFGAAPADARERARQMRFLLARGFSAEIVHRTVPQMLAPHEADDIGQDTDSDDPFV